LWSAAVSFLVLLFFFSPSWSIFSIWARVPEFTQWIEVRRAASLLAQLSHPFAPIADPMHRILQWRLLFPLLGHGLHLPGSLLLALPFVGCLAVIATIIGLARQEGCSAWTAWCGATILSATGWFFVSTGWLGYFDSWLALSLLAVSHARSKSIVWTACLLAPWIDERFIIALPLALSVRLLRAPSPAGDANPLSGCAALKQAGVPIILAGLYAIVRIALAGHGGSQGILEYLSAQQTLQIGLGRHLLGLWESLRVAWVFVFAGIFVLLRPATLQSKAGWGALFFITALTGLLIANDLSRSMIVLLPLAAEGLLRLPTLLARPGKAMAALLVIGLLVPAQHVVTNFTMPIATLPKVLRDWNSIEQLASAKWIELAARQFSGGNIGQADELLDFALRLDARNGTVYDTKGRFAARLQDWETAEKNFAEACRLNPSNPSYWVDRAGIALQLREEAIFSASITEAKRLTPPGSALARQIEVFEAAAAKRFRDQ